MPHGHYFEPFLLCPWSGCGLRIELIDFRLEDMGDPVRYARVMRSWGWKPGYGLLAACPGCGQQVLFTPADKQAVSDSANIDCEIMPDDWHRYATII